MNEETDLISSKGAIIVIGLVRLTAFITAIYFAITGEWDKACFFLLINLLFKINKKDYKEKIIDCCFYHKQMI